MNYKLTVYNNKIYKEISLDDKIEKLSIGTSRECQLVFVREHFFADFKIEILKQGQGYAAVCNEKVYLKSGDNLRENIHYFQPGDSIVIAYTDSDADVFRIDFSVDFGNMQDNYNLAIDITTKQSCMIGRTSACDIKILDEILGEDYITVHKTQGGYEVDASHTKYGVDINGFHLKEDIFKIKQKQFLGIDGYIFYFDQEKLYTTDSGKVVSDLPSMAMQQTTNAYHYPQFIRSVRQQYKIPNEKLEVLPPKTIPEKPKRNLIMILLPILLMLFLMVFVRGKLMGGSASYIIYFAASMVISGFMAVLNYLDNGKTYKEKMRVRIKKYNEYLDKKEEEIFDLRVKERTVFNKRNSTVEETIDFIEHFDKRLFEKSIEQEDYLDIRIGTGTVESVCQIDYKKQEYVETEDPMMDYPEQMHDKYQYLDNMPVILSLAETNAVGFMGNRSKLYQMMKNMILIIAGQYMYKEVKMFIMMDQKDIVDFSWTRWLQNMSSNDNAMRYFMYDEESAKTGLEYLYAELSVRESLDIKIIDALPRFIVFVYRSEYIRQHPVSEYIERARILGFTFLFFEEQEEMLHKACEQKVYLETDNYKGYIQDVKDGEKIQNFVYSHIDKNTASQCALKLGCVYIDDVNLESALTKNISLYELLGIMSAFDLDLGTRWDNSKIYNSMAAPLGVKSGGEIVSLDLHERFHGPHGLVAGTTGSGKSEILQSYILSMATLFHPYEVGFIIIDFKGGGMANQFKELPHLNGAITNIDGKQINRSLMSIKAELLKRQELFAQNNVNKIDDYIKLYKEGKIEIPLPHLILIVDEFAELKSDQPEFMKELISAARIGRSLGVHLILATQKPAGVVNDQIWSNSKFKLCLKVQDKSDSNEVLKSPLAAEIREPGRAYLQVGNNEIFELFQSAFSGAPAKLNSTDATRKFRIDEVCLSGKRNVIYQQKIQKTEGTETQLDAIVECVKVYCEKNRIQKLPDICLPPLGEVISYPTEDSRMEETDIIVPIGVYDDPTKQAQKELWINLTQNHVFLLGSSLSGKTYLVQNMILGLTRRYSPEDVNIYIMDFASMILRSFEDLHHIGGVITISEDDKLKHFMQMMQKKIEERREKLADIGLSSFGSYREAGYREIPQIVIFLENYTVFRATYPEHEEQFLTMCRDGVAAGVSMVITNQQLSGIGYKLLTNFSVKIAMHCNDRGQYSGLLDRCHTYPDNTPGRGVTVIDNDCKEFQTYLVFSQGKEVERIAKVREYIDLINERYANTRADIIVSVPDKVTDAYILKRFGKNDIENYRILAGISYATAMPEYVELRANALMGIMGRDDLGKEKYIKYFLQKLEQHADTTPSNIYVIDDMDRKLAYVEHYKKSVIQYSNSIMEAIDMIESVWTEVKHRYDRMISEPGILEKEPELILLFNSKLIADTIKGNNSAYEQYQQIITIYKACKVCIMFTSIENVALTAMSNAILRQIRDCGNVLLFENLGEVKFINIPVGAVRAYKKQAEEGDAFYIKGSNLMRIKVPLKND